jgi:hypothetical protein
MATQVQTTANRQNAQKSTGPRTTEGKAAVSQNAVKHGLFTRCDVIYGESQDEFDCHHDRILAELAPAGPIESIFAERIVTLSWRLKRAERMQNQALDAKIADYRHDSWVENFHRHPNEAEDDPNFSQPDLPLGRVAIDDFSDERVLDRLQLYERRIEQSLYKAMLEFQKLTLTRKPKHCEDPGTEPQTQHLKKQTQFDSPSSLPEQQPTPSDDSGPRPESAVTADEPRSTECDYATRNPQLVTRNPQMTPHLKKQSQFADCPNECKPNSNKELPQPATSPTPEKTNPIKLNCNRAT